MSRFAKLNLVALCSTVVLATATAQNAPQTPQARSEFAVKLRKAVFDVQSYSFGPVTAMLKGAPFDASTVVTAAQRIQMTSSMIPDVFKVDTRNSHIETAARDGIWTNVADFDQKARGLHDAAVSLETAAKTGDPAMTRQATIAVGKACSACHDEYKNT